MNNDARHAGLSGAFDRSNLQVLANHTRAAAENMAHTLHRTAHSAFVKETQDFTVMLMDRAGQTVAVPMGAWRDMVSGPVLGAGDPSGRRLSSRRHRLHQRSLSGHVATHAPDTHLWKPIFVDGEIIAWAGGHIHNTDMGGAVPASLSRALTEIHQEGVRFPPMKLVREGVFDEQILRIMATTCASPISTSET